jgi:hypothetical protein
MIGFVLGGGLGLVVGAIAVVLFDAHGERAKEHLLNPSSRRDCR